MLSSSRSDLPLIGLAFLAFITLGLGSGLLGLAWPYMQTDFTLPVEAQGGLLLMTTVGFLTASFNSGALVRRFGVGRLLVGGMVLLTLCSLGTAFALTWPLVLLIGLLNGLGGATIDAALNTYVAHHFSERIMNWLHASFGVGITISPLIMSAVFAAGQPWRIGYLIVGVITGVIALLFVVTRSRWQSEASAETDAAPAVHVSLMETLKRPVVWMGIGLLFLCAGLETTPGNWIYSLFTRERGIDDVTAGQWVSFYWGSFTVGRIFFGAIINRVNSQVMLAMCIGAGIIGAALLWWNGIPEAGFIGLLILGFAQAPLYPVLTSQTPQRVGREHAANAIGFQVAGAGAGLALLPALAGLLAGQTTKGSGLGLEIIPPFIFFATVLLFVLYLGSLVIVNRMSGSTQA